MTNYVTQIEAAIDVAEAFNTSLTKIAQLLEVALLEGVDHPNVKEAYLVACSIDPEGLK